MFGFFGPYNSEFLNNANFYISLWNMPHAEGYPWRGDFLSTTYAESPMEFSIPLAAIKAINTVPIVSIKAINTVAIGNIKGINNVL